MDELGAFAWAAGITGAFFAPLAIRNTLRERKESRKKVRLAEELLEKEELGAAYKQVGDVVREYRQKCASKKTRERAREITYMAETRFKDQILAEAREGLAGKIGEIKIDIDLGRGFFSIPYDEYHLEEVSETYRKHFLGQED